MRLRMELQRKGVSQLMKIAEALGCDAEVIDRALDDGKPHSALLELIIAETDSKEIAQLKVDLHYKKVSELRVQARSQGIDKKKIQQALDAASPRQALIDIILTEGGRSPQALDA